MKLTLLFLFAATALASSVCAQDGPYDPSFGDGGKTWIDVTSSDSDIGQRLIVLPSGNLFMVGGCTHACAAWLTPTGALATGFGTSGTGTASFSDFPGWPNDDYGANDAAVFADGRIAVPVVKVGGYVAVLRADGTGLDPAVGNGAGYVSPPFAPLFARVTTQQKLIVVGTTVGAPETLALVVARYDSTLHLDTSFGTGGSTTVGFADGETDPGGMTLQRDGKIAVVGTVLGSPHTIFIVRLTAGGSPDPNFGINSDGKFQSNFGNSFGTNGNAIVEDKKGRLVIAGLALNGSQSGEWLVDRLLGGGATDASFNGGQPQQFTIVSSSTLNGPRACCVALQSDNRIVVAGTMDRPGGAGFYFALSRFFDNGAFDPTFGGGGQSYGDMSSQAPNVTSDHPASLVMVPGGMVVAGHTAVTSNETRFSATRVRIDLLLAADFE